MGLVDKILSQFIEVIEWTDNTSDTLVYRFPVYNKEIKMGAKLTVREGQNAVFINKGQLADVFQPGLHTLSTDNMPILTTLMSWKYGFNSPFKAEVYFVSTRQFTDQKWGTANPVMMRDAEFGAVRLRAFGMYSFKVKDPALFMKEIVGTDGNFTTDEITGQLKKLIISGFSDMLAEAKIPALDLSSKFDELGDAAKAKLQPKFETHGLQLVNYAVENISFPPEVEKMLDKKTSMGIVGDMGKFTQFQVAVSAEEAAKNPGGGGVAAAGVGIGAGAVLGQTLMGAAAQGQATPAAPMVICPKCNAQAPSTGKFCPSCGGTLGAPKVKCVKCQADMDQGAKFCPSCGSAQQAKCPKCQADVTPGTKFCAGCGNQLG